MADTSVAGTIVPEQRVFFLHPARGWAVGTVQSLFADINATVPIGAVTSNNAASLRLAFIVDEATGATEKIIVGGAGGPANNKSSASGGVDSIIHPYVEGAYNPRDHELFRVNDLHISTLLFCLKERYEKMQLQYSWLGETIVSVNPFTAMPYNGAKAQQQYLAALKQGTMGGAGGSAQTAAAGAAAVPINPETGLPTAGPLPPHVWHIAEKAFAGAVVRCDGNQSVVISGESGSGKTENTKAIIDFLGQLSTLHSCNAVQKQLADTVSGLIKACNPILESFGNAKTVRNDNSSRFGKYTKLFFNKESGVIVGGGLVTYLLEKSRIVIQGAGERNYHVFYELLDACNNGGSGLSPALVEQLHLKGKRPADFAILVGGTATNRINKDEPMTRRGTNGRVVSDAREFQNIVDAMKQMNFPQATQDSIWRCVAAVMHLGELKFLTSETNGKAMLDEASRPSLATASKLLGLDAAGADALLQVFLEKSRTKILTTMATQAEAEALRDAYSKALYIALFDFLVAHINTALQVRDLGAGGASSGKAIDVDNNKAIAYVGVLDIFGFENFQSNSFEQLCINFANETLQGHYNRFTFLNDEEECRREGVPSPQVAFPDNSPCLRLFDTPKTGIFAALDEESGFRGGTSDRFTQLLWDQWAPQPGSGMGGGADPAITAARGRFGRPKGTNPTSFSVTHFAATVEYKTAGWLEKNSDTLKEEAAEATAMSGDGFIAALLPRQPPQDENARGPPPKKPSVAKHFQRQLGELMGELTNTTTNFIRCIKPNMPAQPSIIDNGHVGAQLESAGVVQTVALKRQGYPIRRPIENFVKTFRCLCPNAVVGRGGIGIRKGAKGGLPPAAKLSAPEQAKAILNYISTAYDWTPAGIEKRKAQLTQYLQQGGAAAATNKAPPRPADPKAIADEVARSVPPYPYCVVGATKVFLKPIAWAKLELLRRRYNMGRLRKCAPHLRRWAGRYRAVKAEAERKRLAELARLQQEAEARRQREGGGAAAAGGGDSVLVAGGTVRVAGGGGAGPGGRMSDAEAASQTKSLVATGMQSGLDEAKARTFADLALEFNNFDISILLDVVFNLPTREAAAAALRDMQTQRLDLTLPAPMRRLLKECKVRDKVVEKLAANNIATLAQLSALDRRDLRTLGFTDEEVRAVADRMIAQQSTLVANQRLQHEFGGGGDMGLIAAFAFAGGSNNAAAAGSKVKGGAASSSQQNQSQSAPPPFATQQFHSSASASVSVPLPPSGPNSRRGSFSRSGATNSPPPPLPQSRPSSSISRPHHSTSSAAAPSQTDTEQKVARMVEMGIGDRKACLTALSLCGSDLEQATNYLLTGELPARQQQQSSSRNASGSAPPAVPPSHRPLANLHQQAYGYQGGSLPFATQANPPPPGSRPPPVQQQQQQAHRPPPVAGNNNASIEASVDQAHLAQLVAMGFARGHSAMALMQAGNNLDRAMDILMR